jgi:hypothetical protein
MNTDTLALMTEPAPTLLHAVAMTVTFVSETKRFAFCARHDTGESVYVSPMLAELAGLDRKSAGRVLTATIAANIDDMGASSSTPWRVMSWAQDADAVGMKPAAQLAGSEQASLRADLEAALDLIRSALSRLV